MYQKLIKITSVFLSLISICFAQTRADSCLIFASPKPGSIITDPSCTLSVQVACKSIKSVEFQALYYIMDADTPIVTNLGSITRQPYKLIWDISKIPNQYYTGIEFIAIASMPNNEKLAVRRDGVFFLHNPTEQISFDFPYEYSGTQQISTKALDLKSDRSSVKISSSMYWNEKEITVILNVKDPLFYANISRELLSSMGLELLLDPSGSKKPYPDKNILMYAIPLFGKPIQVMYSPAIDSEGHFDLSSSSQPCNFKYSVIKEDFKGFTVIFSIPTTQFNSVIPKSMTCNIISKTLDEKNNVVRSSWVQTDHIFESYSPSLWGTINFQPKPLIKNRILVFGIAFLIGLILTLLFAFLRVLSQKQPKQTKFERSESEQELFEKIKATFEEKVIQKDLTTDKIANELNLTPGKLNSHLKKLAGMSSQHYLMFCRIEIAKERLRSSHWSEVAIAEASGFENATEMEKYFIRFNRVTPYKFRQMQQVT